MQACNRHILQNIGSKGFPQKAIAGDSGTIFQYTMKDVAEDPLISLIFWKNVSQNSKQSAFFKNFGSQNESLKTVCFSDSGNNSCSRMRG